MIINPSYNTSNNYSEGIRINKDIDNWSIITLGGDVGSTSGTNAKTWLIGDNDGTLYLSLNGSDSAATRFRGSGNGFIAYPRLGVNGENTGYNFYVNGTSLFNGAVNMSGVLIVETNNTWLSPSRVQIGRTGTTVYSDRSTIGTTDGNLHLDSYKGHGVYINFYSGKDKSDGTQGTMFSPNGNVNIGTASDKGYKLYVNGNGYFTGNVNIVTNSQPQLNITGTAGNWTYIRLHNGNNLWDIASHRDNISGSLQLRAGGSDTNRAVFNTNGRLDIYSTQGSTNAICINSNNGESSIAYGGVESTYTKWTVGRGPGGIGSTFGWWNGSRNVMWLENTGILHIGTEKNYNELRIHGAFDASGTGIQDGNDRPSLKITGNYPQLVLMGGGIGNDGHGATFAIGAWDGANATSGNFKTWTFGTPGYNAAWMDLAYNVNGTNPHNGINDYTQSGTTHHRLIRFRGDTQQLLLYGIGNDQQPTLQISSSRDGSWVYNAGFLAPNLTANHNNFIVLGKAMSTRNSFGFTHMHIADGSTSNYGAVEIFGVGNAQRWYYDRHSAFMARLDVANQANDANYMYSALQIREYNYGGVQADTWAIAPRLSWHWSGRVQTQIGLASNGELYLSKNNFANAYKLVYETGTWGINISGNAATATKLQTARNIILNGNLQGSASFNGTGDVTITALNYQSNVSGGNTYNYPWHRIATTVVGTGQYIDKSALLRIRHTFDGGGEGLVKISVRTNSTGSICNISAIWLYRYNIAANNIGIGLWGVTGDNVYVDVYYKCAYGWPRAIVESISNGRIFTLISSNEVDNTTTTDKKTSSEVYTSIENGATLIRGQAYTRIIYGSDGVNNDRYVLKTGDTMTGHLNSNSEFITTSQNGFRISAASSTSTKSILLRNDGSDFYILCCNSTAAGNNWYIPTGGAHPFKINLTTGYSYFSRAYGAVWNDYAEYRSTLKVQPGQCVVETGLGDLIQSTKRLQPGANIVSDTFGFAIGETEQTKTPLAVSGRVLAYPYEDRYSYSAGDPVCSGPNGTVSKMTRKEVREYPDRIVGTVSEIPEYETWGTGNVKVNGRIWIKVK